MQAQGQTLDAAGLYMGRDFFSHGQVYVAFSRVGNPGCIKVKSNATKKTMSNTIRHLKGAEAKGTGREGKTSEDEERGLQGCLGLKI